MTKRLIRFGLLLCALAAAACAAGNALRRGDAALKAGDYDQAVSYYRSAVQASPDNPNYKIALERAMLVASRTHLDRARDYEDHDQLEAARSEYKLASEYDPANGFASLKVAMLDQKIRDRNEAARPRPMDQMLAAARAATAPPLLNPASHDLLTLHFTGARVGTILDSIANSAGISVSYDRDAQSNLDRPVTMQLDGLTLEEALTQVMTMNQLSYKIINERSIFVFQDNTAKHGQFDEQVIRTFYIANADITEMSTMLASLTRFAGMAILPQIVQNKTQNTIVVRATAPVMAIIERMIRQNDKPKAEVMFDVEILEVDRSRAKQYGLNLTDYAVGGIFSPEVSPGAATTTGATTTAGGTTTPTATATTTGRSTPPTGVTSPPPFNLNTISQGVSTTDFYLAVPAAIVRFLESDTHTRLVAKPQLRGADGAKITVNLGNQVPVVSTSYTPIATGGSAVNPLNSFTLKDVGINIEVTPRVTLDGDIIVDLVVESSQQGPDQNIAGTNYPSFVRRAVNTHLRLRDGESNLLAGLLSENDTNTVQGVPGAVHVPLLRQLFSNNQRTTQQTDIVMLLTPHIIRTSEITTDDLKAIYIGSQQNLGVGGPPPLIAPQEPAPPAGAPQAAPPALPQSNVVPGGVTVAPPPGSSPVPGTVPVPQPPPPGPQGSNVAPPAGTNASATSSGAPGPAAPSASLEPSNPPPPAPASAAALEQTSPPAVGGAQVIVTPPPTPFRVGGGPYTVPISVVNASRLSTVTLTLYFDPALLRVRSVQEGSFMRTGGVNATFTNQTGSGRVDITIARSSDATGASGTGLLGAVLFDAVAPGSATLTVAGVATGPGGTAMGLQFRPTVVAIQP